MTQWDAPEAEDRSGAVESGDPGPGAAEPAVADDGVDGAEPSVADEQGERRSTGHAGVDEVVASLAGLDQRPVADHVAVFESAHDTLRRALSRAGDEPAPDQG